MSWRVASTQCAAGVSLAPLLCAALSQFPVTAGEDAPCHVASLAALSLCGWVSGHCSGIFPELLPWVLITCAVSTGLSSQPLKASHPKAGLWESCPHPPCPPGSWDWIGRLG